MSFKVVLLLLFGTLMAAIGILVVVSFEFSQEEVYTTNWINRSKLIIEDADRFLMAYEQLLLASRTGSSADPHSISLADEVRYNLVIKEFTELTASADGQYRNQIDSLRILLHEVGDLFDGVNVGNYKFTDSIFTDQLNANHASVVKLCRYVSQEENALKKAQQDRYAITNLRLKQAFVLLVVFIAMLLLFAFLVVRYNFNRRVRAQDELKNANELLGKLFYESPIAVVLSEADTGIIINCNEVYAKIVNIPKAEIYGKSAAALGIMGDGNLGMRLYEGLVGKSDMKYDEIYIQPRGQAKIWVSLSVESIVVNGKKCFLTAIQDLSMHKRAEEEIRKALDSEIELNKMKSNFVTMASHEFRTPLTTILSSAFLLENIPFAEREKIKKHLGRIKTSVNNLTAILDEFLSVTKIEEGRVHANLEKIDVKKFFENACQNLQLLARSGQSIVYQHAGDDEAATDPVLLGNILNNIVTNSIKYSGENSPIIVSANVNSNIYLQVKDAGIGIPEKDQKHLFQRFYRASNAGTVQGTGLGLHIMKHYVEMLNGTVHINSEEGKGTEVDVVLPLDALPHMLSEDSARAQHQ